MNAAGQPRTQPLLELQGVKAAYGTIQVLHGVDLSVPEGSVVALLGPNGAGKTTFLRILASLSRPALGEVRIAGYRLPQQAAAVRRILGA